MGQIITRNFRAYLSIFISIAVGYVAIATIAPFVFKSSKSSNAIASAERPQISLAPNSIGIINSKDCFPKLPRHAHRFEITGTSGIRFKYNERGIIYSAWVVKSAGSLEAHKVLDDAALMAVFNCRIGVINAGFIPRPGTKGGSIVPLQLKAGESAVEFLFSIEGVTAPNSDFSIDHRFPIPNIETSSWRPVGPLTSPVRNFIHTDMDRISPTSVRFWMLISSDIEKFEPSSQIRLHDFDCSTGQSKILQTTTFRLPMAAGPHISVLSKEISLPRSQPQTILATVESIACEATKP
jgi:hypothetical protein